MGLFLMRLIVGGIVGWLASVLMHTDDQMGIIANVAVGMAGAVIGSWIFGLLGFGVHGVIAYLIVATVGAVVLIAGLQRLGVYR